MNYDPEYTVPLATVLTIWALALVGLYLRGIMQVVRELPQEVIKWLSQSY